VEFTAEVKYISSDLTQNLDDVGSIVFDLGSHTFKFGYGGEEYPKFVVPSVVGVHVDAPKNGTDEKMEVDKENGKIESNRKQRIIGTERVNVPRENKEIKKFMKDCMIEDWDLFEQMMDYAYEECLVTDSKNHGALFSEPTVCLEVIL
jgi:actin-like protein 6B